MQITAALLGLVGFVVIGGAFVTVGGRLPGSEIFRGGVSLFHCLLVVPLVFRRPSVAAARWLAMFFAVAGVGGVVIVVPYLPIDPVYRRIIAESTFAAAALAGGMLLGFARETAVPLRERRGSGGVPSLMKYPVIISTLVAVVYIVLVIMGEMWWAVGQVVAEAVVVSWLLVAFCVTMLHFVRELRTSHPAHRVAVKWNLLAVVLWLLAGVVGFGTVWLRLLGTVTISLDLQIMLFAPLFLAGSATMAYGVLAKGSIDPDLALRRSVIAGGVATTGLFAFGLLEAVLSDVLLWRLGVPSGGGLWLAAGSLAVAVHPLSQWFRPRVNDWFDRWEVGRAE